jgi:RimJ/RimL family protein N-acetyltransferase
VKQPPLSLVEPLTDGVVTLRMLHASDREAIVDACQDPEIPRWTMIPKPYEDKHFDGWLGASSSRAAEGTELSLVIVDNKSGELVGATGVRIDRPNLIGDIGYWCVKEARGRGFVPRAVSLLSRHCFEELGLARLEITTHLDNASSQRVAEKAGYQREGVMRSYRDQRGTRVDLVMWSLLPGDLDRR